MKIYNIELYNSSKKKLKELSKYLDSLDKVADLLYNNLGYTESWAALQIIEDARVKYGTLHYECELVIKNKGLDNEKNPKT